MTPVAKSLMPVRAKALLPDEHAAFFEGRVPWRLLAIPFGGPIPSPTSPRGVDLDGQWFSENTDIFGRYAALKATRDRLVDWHHSLKPINGRGGDPTGTMNGVVLGKAVLDEQPDADGWWVDFWAKAGEKRLGLIRQLVERGVQLFGSAQSANPYDTAVKADTGEITRFPFLLETISTSVQNTLSVVRPKAVLDDLDSSELQISPAMRSLLAELDAIGAELPQSFRSGGDAAVKAGGVSISRGFREFEDALASLETVRDRYRGGDQP